jgi:hypothetical protein
MDIQENLKRPFGAGCRRSTIALRTSGSGPNPPEKVTGRARQLCSGNSDVEFFGDLKRVVTSTPS